jgi:hypothetical protein
MMWDYISKQETDLSQKFISVCYNYIIGVHVLAQLFEVLYYKPEGRWFDFRCCHWNFSMT